MSKVAVIPLAKFTSEADHKLVADLATSVERNATLKAFDAAIVSHEGDFHPEKQHIRRALRELRRVIEQGRHV